MFTSNISYAATSCNARKIMSEKHLCLACETYYGLCQLEKLFIAQKIKFSIKDFFTKCDQIRMTADVVTFTEEILNKKLHFLSSVL